MWKVCVCVVSRSLCLCQSLMLLPPCMGQARPFHNKSPAILGKVLTGSHKPTDARTAFDTPALPSLSTVVLAGFEWLIGERTG